jgi:hypothetical protein
MPVLFDPGDAVTVFDRREVVAGLKPTIVEDRT